MKIKDLILNKRFISAVLVVTFGVSCITAYAGYRFINTNFSPDAAEERTVQELSEKTGASKEQIRDLRLTGRSFGEIGEMLSSGTSADSVISNEQLEKLTAEFSEELVKQAQALSDRVSFALREINQRKVQEAPNVPTEQLEKKEDLTPYYELYENYEPNKAIYLMLKLNNDETSMHSVMDEYLLALQLEIDLTLKFSDAKAYEEEYQKNIVKIAAGHQITVSKLEAKMLEVIQQQQKIDLPVTEPAKPETDIPENVKPADPLEEVQKEIEKFQNPTVNSINGGNTDEE